MEINYLELLGSRKIFEWTPYLSCQTESEAPTARYEVQQGYGVIIKINEMYSLRYFTFTMRGYIDAISDGDNYAAIRGLPYADLVSWANGTVVFNVFYQGIGDEFPMPTGRASNDGVYIYNSTVIEDYRTWRGSSVASWVVSSLRFDIRGSAWQIIYNEGMAPEGVNFIDE